MEKKIEISNKIKEYNSYFEPKEQKYNLEKILEITIFSKEGTLNNDHTFSQGPNKGKKVLETIFSFEDSKERYMLMRQIGVLGQYNNLELKILEFKLIENEIKKMIKEIDDNYFNLAEIDESLADKGY